MSLSPRSVWAAAGAATLLIGTLLGLPATLYAEQSPAPHAQQSCTFGFFATVEDGPHAGLTLRGDLALDISPTGEATGQLTTDDGTVIPAVGQITGRAVSLSFDLSGPVGPE